MMRMAQGGEDIDIKVIILAAGHSTRMKSSLPKMLHEVGGLQILGHVLKAARSLTGLTHSIDPSPGAVFSDGSEADITKRYGSLSIVTGPHAPEVGEVGRQIAPELTISIQDPPRGTADAVSQALKNLEELDGFVFVLNGDTPFITPATLNAMKAALSAGAALVVLGFEAAVPGNYGRLEQNASGDLLSIIEAKDATSDELEITLCNAGVMAFQADILRRELPKISDNNAKGEYYLTDMVALVNADGGRCVVIHCPEEEVMGIDTRADLAAAEEIFQNRIRADMMASGVTLRDPASIYLSHDTRIEADVTINPHVIIGPGVTIAGGTIIHSFSHIEQTDIAQDAVIGPFARLRPGTQVGARAKVGNFVEIKKATLEDGAKVNHLSYIGDASVGAGANIGAGTITCNYDGYDKFKTTIGTGAFIGSNSALVAPVTIGAGAYIGSGSVITRDVSGDSLAIARGRQVEKSGWAALFRSKKADTD